MHTESIEEHESEVNFAIDYSRVHDGGRKNVWRAAQGV